MQDAIREVARFSLHGRLNEFREQFPVLKNIEDIARRAKEVVDLKQDLYLDPVDCEERMGKLYRALSALSHNIKLVE